MSLTSGFHNSLNGDRRYNASQISAIFDGLVNDGVFMSIGDALIVKVTTGMVVSVGEGRAWFNHTWTYNDAQLLLTLDPSELVLNRIDAVVLEINSTDSVRANAIKVIKGTPGTTPTNPSLIKTEDINQYPLCYIYVGAGVSSITQGNITNKIGTSDCPFVTGILETIDIDDLISQWASEFEAWFATLENVLDDNTAGNLLNMINATNNNLNTTNSNVTTLGNNISTTNTNVTNLGANKLNKNAGTIESYSEKMESGNASGAIALDLSIQNTFRLALTGNITPTFTNVPASPKVVTVTLIIDQPATARAITFPSSFHWAGGILPDLSGASKTHIVYATTTNGGVSWYASAATNFTT